MNAKRVTLSASRKGTTMNLKSMSLGRLANLRDQVNSALVAKVANQRRTLELELSKISRFQVGGARTKSGRGGPTGSVAPKYRNPENATETWAGRGLKPRWLTAALKSGKKLEDFAIAGGTGRSKPAMRRVGSLKGSFVAPKYRNPENAGETWAGRGLRPRWLAAALKSGKRLEDFAIAASAHSAKANGRKKAGRPRK
jgi:DNA-binding protein H-NS